MKNACRVQRNNTVKGRFKIRGGNTFLVTDTFLKHSAS